MTVERGDSQGAAIGKSNREIGRVIFFGEWECDQQPMLKFSMSLYLFSPFTVKKISSKTTVDGLGFVVAGDVADKKTGNKTRDAAAERDLN